MKSCQPGGSVILERKLKMSYPSYLLSCCHGDSDGDMVNSTLTRVHLILTNDVTQVICIISSAVSLLGVCFLLLPRSNVDLTSPFTHSRILTGPSLKLTVSSLFTADILADVGILIRSCVWLSGYPIPALVSSGPVEQTSYGMCIVFNLWIQYMYFYLCSYCWSLNFSLELYTSVNNCQKMGWSKYLIGWVLPGILCATAAAVLYYPSLQSCYRPQTLEWIILFLVVFIPILIVIVVNPILFCISAKTIRRKVIVHSGKYTNTERDLMEAVRLKLTVIFSVFIFCWMPNIIAVVLEILPSDDSSFFAIFHVLWLLMAICNPVQALFNCLAYHGWPGWSLVCNVNISCTSCRKRTRTRHVGALFLATSSGDMGDSDETTPILIYRGQNSSISASYTDQQWR